MKGNKHDMAFTMKRAPQFTLYTAATGQRVPSLPGKAWKRQMPFRGDDGIFEEDFIEDRRKGLEQFVNKLPLLYIGQDFLATDSEVPGLIPGTCRTFLIAGHPLAQNEKCLHMFLQEPVIDKNYVPGKIRNA
ncbi:unnamed protein product [Timema podura]|uniref:Sorting nexin-3 n=1 Tax=Timema podura TaxID=61482 RepID=A0ABN7PAV4_TIMPD|nr:unnamed protein product [Timema podura]